MSNDTFALNIDLLKNGQIVTQYIYNNGQITLVARPGVATFTPEEMKHNIELGKRWIGVLVKHLSPQRVIRSNFYREKRKNATEVAVKAEVAGEQVTDASYNISTGIFTFAARPEIIMNFQDFVTWVNFLERFYKCAIECGGA